MSRVIAHIDMNCFYASVEEKYNPELRGKPLAIAGTVKTRHGIIVTSNYEARKLGIKTTMRVGDARKICPTIKFLQPDMEKYQRESKLIFDLIREYTTKVVPIISIGTKGYIGAAQVTGPASSIEQVKAVAQVEGSFNGMVRVKGLVPVDSTNPVGASRVQGVGVSAIIDLKI